MTKDSLIFTTSWDDGSIHDVKLAKLFDKYAISGTFYIPKNFGQTTGKFYTYHRRLTSDEVRQISVHHEIGAHGLSHQALTSLTAREVDNEMRDSKNFLEKIIQKPVISFCYPQGKHTEREDHLAAAAGYKFVRDTSRLTIIRPSRPSSGVTIRCGPFPLRKRDQNHYYWSKLFEPVSHYTLGQYLTIFPAWRAMYSWPSFSRAILKWALDNGNYFHLYGHSWEIEKYQMWRDLENFLKYVKGFSNIKYVTNGQLVDFQ